MGVEPTRVCVVEDTVSGVQAACAAGMTAYGFAGLTPAARLREAGAQATFTQLRELRPLLG
ncbi:MAG TPA: HAD family hydrolase, partial [Gammaproteobacteria bacterium]|nr:HAD family hydrolase [Gammaproteobacteria bacterium]